MELFQTKVVEKIKTYILCSITFFRKSCRVWECRKTLYSHRWKFNTVHALCMLDN